MYYYSTDAIIIQTRCVQSVVSLENIFLPCSRMIKCIVQFFFSAAVANSSAVYKIVSTAVVNSSAVYK